MMVALWIVVGIVALVVFGPIVLELIMQPGRPVPARKSWRAELAATPAWAVWLAIALVVVFIVAVIMAWLS